MRQRLLGSGQRPAPANHERQRQYLALDAQAIHAELHTLDHLGRSAT
ncbi:hypothetical protein [Hymenobacter segetis]